VIPEGSGVEGTGVKALRAYLVAPALAVAVGVGLAVFGTVHDPDYTTGLLGRDYADATRLKAWLTTVVAGLALVQLVLALWIYGRLPRAGTAPRWAHVTHRVNGAAVVALTLPIAWHCLTAYGFQTGSSRVLVHSLAGCAFYAVFVAKVCLVHDRRAPMWRLPVAGTLLLLVIAALWYSAALWVFNGYHVPLLS
jgi:hypothetical protein